MKKRRTTEEEKAIFREAVDKSAPLKPVLPKAGKAALSSPKGKKLPPPALDANTAARLKRGGGVPEARLDLHGLNEAAAHRALLAFLARAQKDGLRLVLVITGKGNPGKQDGAAWALSDGGVLKQMVPRWLNEKPFSPLASGSSPAHRRHGGDGALYVTLRKHR